MDTFHSCQTVTSVLPRYLSPLDNGERDETKRDIVNRRTLYTLRINEQIVDKGDGVSYVQGTTVKQAKETKDSRTSGRHLQTSY